MIDFRKLAAAAKAARETPTTVQAPVPTVKEVEVPAPTVVENAFLARLRNKPAAKPDAREVITAIVESNPPAPEREPEVINAEAVEALPTKKENAFLAKMRAVAEAKKATEEVLALSPVATAVQTTTADDDYFEHDGTRIPRITVAGARLNDKQMLGCLYAMRGESFVFTGAAGTGKTTGQAGVVQMLDESNSFGTHDFKYIGEADSIAIVAFTKVAVRNIQKAVRKNPVTAKYAHHCMTIHALLEYEPVREERIDPESGLPREITIFRPQRHAGNPLSITHLIVEESSMVGLDLWANLLDALLPGVQIIFLGDINQLQPVFGRPILGYALCQLPVIELTEVYRQALDNPIIANAHRVLKGEPIQSSECGRVAVISGNGNYKVGQDTTATALTKMFERLYDLGEYDPMQDMILCPWNKKALGTKWMGENIATFLGLKRNAEVFEVRAGFNTVYVAVGDRVLVDKQMGIITAIKDNPKYVGADVKAPGAWTRRGIPVIGAEVAIEMEAPADGPNYDNLSLESIRSINEEDDGEKKERASSHIVSVQFDNDYDEETGNYRVPPTELSSAGAFRYEVFQFGYCMTVHKAQGSEFRKVFFIAHYDHAVSVSREMIYTALTRARESFVALCKEDFLINACKRAEIKGTTLEAKIAYFNSGTDAMEAVQILPSAA